MDTAESSASAEDHDDTLEAHFAGLERLRPHACYDGVVYIGYLVVAEDGEEVEVVEAVHCRRSAGDVQ